MKIIADVSESRSGVIEALRAIGADVTVQRLAVGDYILSDRIAVERKRGDDLEKTLAHRKQLFPQIGDLCKAYANPCIIIETTDPLFLDTAINRISLLAAIGILSTVYRTPIHYTKDPQETAERLVAIAGYEQRIKKRIISVHGSRRKMSLGQQQEYVLSAINGIGPVTARRMLEKWKTVHAVLNAGKEEWAQIHNVGPAAIKKISDVLYSEYVPRERGKV